MVKKKKVNTKNKASNFLHVFFYSLFLKIWSILS
jgi:hypothetical protein